MDNIGREGLHQRDDEDRYRPRYIYNEFTRTENTDADWHAHMQRRRLQRFLSTSIFICFLVLFFDTKNGLPRKQSFRASSPMNVEANQSVTIRKRQINELLDLLRKEEDNHIRSPLNVSGIFSGKWKQLKRSSYENLVLDDSKNHAIKTQVVRTFSNHLNERTSISSVQEGSLWIFIQMKSFPDEPLQQHLALITGQAILHDKNSAFAATIFSIQGTLQRQNGKLVLFGNQPDANLQLTYPRINENFTINSTSLKQKLGKDISEMKNSSDIVSTEVFNITPSKAKLRRNPNLLSEQCYYRMNLQVDYNNSLNNSISPNLVLSGTLGSPNCDLYMEVTAEFENQDLHHFYSKATQYAVIMTMVSMLQIYVLLRQLHSSNTQAGAAKVSLLTIGQQAIIDSYLCLLHLTSGVIARQIFTAFATVSFFKLIIFSIFEMRYLLLIWKARRPQSFAEGWLTVRREYTVLYSRFYCTLLCGILIVYNFWNYINILVFIAYSFWVPQIVHNAHREVRNALDKVYLLGMSALRLVLPIYLYAWPGNFPSAFPMYHYQPNYTMCYILVLWMIIQVSILIAQQRLGPRFFIPARFLPQKYNYHRRLDPSELSLLKTSSDDDDKIDCVICMVSVDIECRDYMLAPCDHIFHRECLEQWMEIKMECPTCRHVLPQP